MNDPELSKLLKNWQTPPVPGDFDQNVWRRIRMRQPAPAPAGWRAWLHAPLRLATAAAMLALSLGTWAGWRTRPTPPAAPAFAFAFASGETFTGSYLGLHKGHTP